MVFKYEILFLVIKFVLNKINVLTQYKLNMLFLLFLNQQGGMFVSL